MSNVWLFFYFCFPPFLLFSFLCFQVYEILYNSSGADNVEPVSVDEAYLEFFIPLPEINQLSVEYQGNHNNKDESNKNNSGDRKGKTGRIGVNTSKDDNNDNNDNNKELYPSQFGIMKAEELRERIFRETGCSARYVRNISYCFCSSLSFARSFLVCVNVRTYVSTQL